MSIPAIIGIVVLWAILGLILGLGIERLDILDKLNKPAYALLIFFLGPIVMIFEVVEYFQTHHGQPFPNWIARIIYKDEFKPAKPAKTVKPEKVDTLDTTNLTRKIKVSIPEKKGWFK